MTKRRSSWSGPKSEEWDFGPVIDEDNLFLDPEIGCQLELQMQRAAGKRGIFSGLGLWSSKEEKVPKFIECDDQNYFTDETERNDSVPLLENNNRNPVASKGSGRGDINLKDINWGSLSSTEPESSESFSKGYRASSPHFGNSRKLDSRSDHRGLVFESPRSRTNFESKSEHRRTSVPLECSPSSPRRIRSECKSEHRRSISVDVHVELKELTFVKANADQIRNNGAPMDSNRGTIPMKVEINCEKRLQFLAENKPETELEAMNHLSIASSDPVEVVQLWEMDPEDDASFAQDLDSMPADLPPESPFPDHYDPSTFQFDTLNDSSRRSDKKSTRSNPRVASPHVRYELEREHSIRSMESLRRSPSSALRNSDRSRHSSVKITEKSPRGSSKYNQASERSQRAERSLDRSSTHSRRDPSLVVTNQNSQQKTRIRENHSSHAGTRDITYERTPQDHSTKSSRSERQGSRSIHYAVDNVSLEPQDKKYVVEFSERRQRSGSVTSSSRGDRRSPVNTPSRRSPTNSKQGQPTCGVMTTTLDSASSHRSRATALSSASLHRAPQQPLTYDEDTAGASSHRRRTTSIITTTLNSSSMHRAKQLSTSMHNGASNASTSSNPRPRAGSTTLQKDSLHRSRQPFQRQGSVHMDDNNDDDDNRGRRRRHSLDDKARRPRSSSVPKETNALVARSSANSTSSSRNGNINNANTIIYRKPLDGPKVFSASISSGGSSNNNGKTPSGNNNTALNRSSLIANSSGSRQRGGGGPKGDGSRKAYLDSVFGLGANSYHGGRAMSFGAHYKSAPAG